MSERDFLRENFDRDARQRVGRAVGYRWIDLLEVASELQVKHGLEKGCEASGGKGREWERLRSVLHDLRREGYVSREWDAFGG